MISNTTEDRGGEAGDHLSANTLSLREVPMSVALQTAYLRGFIDGLRHFAWWKDGVEYVGTCGTTLKQAIDAAKRDYAVIEEDAVAEKAKR
jgi:hypothetical protein